MSETFADLLPRHLSLSINHNEHKNYYLTVAQFLDDDRVNADWVADGERERAIESNEIWTAQWYPSTPIGFHVLAASTIEALLAGLKAARDERPNKNATQPPHGDKTRG